MRVVKVIHGYPMRYNAGSEVYSQTLCHGLAERGHEVHVFTREEDSFVQDFAVREERDADDPRVHLRLVNVARSRDRYRHGEVDQRFAALLDKVQPHVVHIGHLNHLSTSLVSEANRRGIPTLYTLHDFWIMCPRGQLMQMHPADRRDLWAVCDGQEDRKCAERCYARYFSGADDERGEDLDYWTGWVRRRMRHIREIVDQIDLFVAPSRKLLARYRDDFGLLEAKGRYLDYGFDHARLSGRARARGEPFTFGYIGTHIPAKGIHLLIDAFGRLRGAPRLRIWGRPRGQDTDALQGLGAALPGDAGERIEWSREYRNQEIVRDVFDRVDAIVVPSIWFENSPLVIHEAQQARVPVITADVGGMAEYVHHELNGLLFRHRDPTSLAAAMQRLIDDPALARRLGERGYPYSETGDVPRVEEHVRAIESIYDELLRRRDSASVRHSRGPWRITFDTNPDTCNLHCVMCEEHSPHSPLQIRRKQEGRPRRVMPIELIERVIAEAAPRGLREVIPSTMGEPLLYSDFDRLLELCREHQVKLNLTTNGTFPGRGAHAWAEVIVPVTSDVKISWNGATAATHEAIMIGARWERVVENVREFIAVRDKHAAAGGDRCRVTFQLTFLESNVAELADIVRLALDLGVDRVKGHHLWAH
ncbi:MAG: glycosyltransferase, partial [Myxococcales bacterium]|nr:glycosyltransferase [Myxococcales bacterium]